MKDTKTQNTSAYHALADWFEILNDDCGYEEWSQYLIKRLEELSVGERGIDVGCGSGYFTRSLKKQGYEMTGVDISADMLTKAEELSLKEGLQIPYIQCDITKLKVMEKADFILAVNDCVNYVERERVLSAFKRVYACLKKGGVFLFDVSSENKLKNKVADKVSADDREEVTYLSFNSLEQDKVCMDVTLFVKEKNGLFRRFDERHLLYIYHIEEIKDYLTQAGFTIESVTGHLGEGVALSDRIEFTARK